MSKPWMKPLLIAAILALTVFIIIIAVMAGDEPKSATSSELKVVATKSNKDYRYNVYSNQKVGIVSYRGDSNIITIPEKIDKMPVAYIEQEAFMNSTLTGIVLPETLESIADKAFYGCEQLSALTIPKSVKTVGLDSFLIEKNKVSSFIPWVYNAETDYVVVGDGILIAYIGPSPVEMEIPKEVKHISRFYFRGDSISKLVLPGSLRSIGKRAFENFTNIQSVKLPSSLTTIDERAFYNCRSMTDLDIPKAVKSIGKEAFYCCNKLESVKLGGADIIGENAFAFCIKLNKIKLNDGLDTIGAGAFNGCESLSEIEIPNSVQTIGPAALQGTDWMESKQNEEFVVTTNGMLVGYNGPGGQVAVDDENIKIIADAFTGRNDVTDLILGNSVLRISDSAFENCTSLKAVITSKYMTSIGNRAFAGCTSLKQADLLDGIKEIGDSAFEGCTSLTRIKLPKDLEMIPEKCFYRCTALTDVTLPTELNCIEANAFSRCSIKEVTYDGSDSQRKKVKIEKGNSEFSICFGR